MATFFLVLHLFVCVLLVFVVLIQSGKDGGMGMMASGSSQTVFGSSGGANFFTKFTSGAAAVFMITSIILTATRGAKKSSVFNNVAPVAAPTSATMPPAPSATPAATTTPTTAPATSPAPAEQSKKQ